MQDLTLICAALVALVLAVSGVAKLLDRRATRDAVVALGVPAPLVTPVTAVLAPVELVIALLLLSPVGRSAAVAAVLLLLAFTAVVVANLLAGRRPSCGCFGGPGSSDVSWRTVARNAMLVAAAVAATGERGVTSVGPVVVGVLLAIALFGVEHLLSRRQAAAAEDEQAVGLDAALADDDAPAVPAPDFSLTSTRGQQVTRDQLLAAGLPVLLVFLHPGCSSCRRMVPAVRGWHDGHADRLTVAVVQGDPLRDDDALGDTGELTVLKTPDEAVAESYGVRGTPAAVLLKPGARVVGTVGYGRRGAFRLLEVALLGEGTAGTEADDLDLQSRPAPRPTVSAEPGEAGALLIDEANGARMELDVPSWLVWQCLNGSARLDEISLDLAAVFEVDLPVVQADVLRVVRALGAGGLLVGVRPAPVVEKEPA